MNKIIYHYWDINTYHYQKSVPAQIDPLESEVAGHNVYCGCPQNATEKEPLKEKKGFYIVWNGSDWEYEAINEPESEPTPEEIKQQQIAELKAELTSTDYKIIKCSECSLAGVDLPYDIAELHAQRQALRDEINELEGE